MKVVGKDYIDYWQAMSANLQGQKSGLVSDCDKAAVGR